MGFNWKKHYNNPAKPKPLNEFRTEFHGWMMDGEFYPASLHRGGKIIRRHLPLSRRQMRRLPEHYQQVMVLVGHNLWRAEKLHARQQALQPL